MVGILNQDSPLTKQVTLEQGGSIMEPLQDLVSNP